MPGKRKRSSTAGQPRGKRRQVEDDLELRQYDSDDLDPVGLEDVSGDDEDIMFNQKAGADDDAPGVDPRYGHRVEGGDIDAFLDGDVDKEEMEMAGEEQTRRAGLVAEDDFGLSDLLPSSERKAGRKRPRSKTRDYSRELDALDNFFTQLSDKAGGAEQVEKDYSSLSREAKAKMLARDAPEVVPMLKEFSEKLSHARSTLVPVIQKVKAGELPTSDGVAFLDIKLQLFLSYLMHVCFYLVLKAEGKPIKNNPVVGRLVELRVYMDRLKPIEKRLQHQISRLLSKAAVGEGEGMDLDDAGGKANLADLAAAAPTDDSGLFQANRTAAAGGDADEKKRRQKRMLELHKEKVAQQEEAAMARAPSSRKESKLLKRAQNVGLDDSVGEAPVDAGIKGTLLDGGVGIMARVRERALAGGTLEGDDDGADDSDDSDDEEGEESEEAAGDVDAVDKELDDFYKAEVAAKQAAKRSKKKESRAAALAQDRGPKRGELTRDQTTQMDEGHRKVTKEIVQNKGLTPKRPKKFKNPRVRSKNRARKLDIKRRSQVKDIRKQTLVYGGERNVRTDIVRSNKMK